MPKTPIERHEGHKVQMWVPDDLYAALKTRAVEHDTSIAEELRQSASAGLDPLNGIDDLQKALTDLRQFLRMHLEPLTFIAAMDAAYSREAWRLQLYGARPADAAEVDRKLGEKATRRLQRKLSHLPKSKAEVEESDGDDDENDVS